jgi:transcriptional regulator with XRE-family HTH domain
MRDLAPLLDITSFSFISKLENGSQKPSADLIVKIARLFEVSTDQLMLDELELDD